LPPWPRGTKLPLAGLGFELPWAEVHDAVGVGRWAAMRS
jgi:hypothetical protein